MHIYARDPGNPTATCLMSLTDSDNTSELLKVLYTGTQYTFEPMGRLNSHHALAMQVMATGHLLIIIIDTVLPSQIS